jgi:hypothetical protein
MPDLLLIGGNDRSLWANRGELVGELLETGWEVHGALPPEDNSRFLFFPADVSRLRTVHPLWDGHAAKRVAEVLEKLM